MLGLLMADELVLEQKRRIDEAVTLVAAAQQEVDQAIAALSSDTPRAEKTIIGQVLRDALDKLSRARKALEQASI